MWSIQNLAKYTLLHCEDPETVVYGGDVWPLPHTGQMWLEYEQLREVSAPFFCDYLYRAEPNPVEGRHESYLPHV